MAIKLIIFLSIALLEGMVFSCQPCTFHSINNNDRIPCKYIIHTQYIADPQDGSCYGYIDSVLYWKKSHSDILLVYTSELTGENIYSPYNIIIIKEDGIIHVPCLNIYSIRESEHNILTIRDSGTLAGTISMGTHTFHFGKEIVHDYSYTVDSLGANVLNRNKIDSE